MSWRDLGDGIHRLRVRGTDAAGNRDATPASRAWRVDTRGPWVRGAGPTASTRDRTPTLRATISDAGGQLTRSHLDLRVDGKVASWVHYDVRRGLMAWTPQRGLAPGRHSVRLVAVDKVGNRTVTQWGFTIRR